MGGKAFDNTEPVAKKHIQPVIKRLQRILQGFEYKTLGSTGKKDYSGDIDLAVSDNRWAYGDLVAALTRALGSQNVNTHGYQFNQIYTRVEVGGKMAQVDFMLGNMDLLEFTHWSPAPGTSKYSGSHRTEYLKAVAKALSTTCMRDGKFVARVGYTLHHDKGLVYSARWCAPRKDGKGFVVKMTDVPQDSMLEFHKLFPELNFGGKEIHVNPDAICEKLFGHGVTAEKVNSYEQIASLIQSNPTLLSEKDLIWRLYTERLDEIGLPYPERIV